jgi:glutathione S-transferase
MIQLHYYPGNASTTPHILLHELGAAFELKLVDRARDANRSPEYLKLNPNGVIPTLVDGDLVLFETAAICLHLLDTHPDAGLIPPLGTHERAHFYKWLVWMSASVQSMMVPHYFYPERMVEPGNTAGAAEVKAHAAAWINAKLDLLDAHFAAHGGPWMMGERYSGLDPYAFMLCRWTRGFARPARSRPHLGPFLARMLERPAVQRVAAHEQWAQPLV